MTYPTALFDRVFNRLIGNEGAYTNGLGDPGGETNWGISKRSYPDVDIANLTREGAKAMAKRRSPPIQVACQQVFLNWT